MSQRTPSQWCEGLRQTSAGAKQFDCGIHKNTIPVKLAVTFYFFDAALVIAAVL